MFGKRYADVVTYFQAVANQKRLNLDHQLIGHAAVACVRGQRCVFRNGLRSVEGSDEASVRRVPWGPMASSSKWARVTPNRERHQLNRTERIRKCGVWERMAALFGAGTLLSRGSPIGPMAATRYPKSTLPDPCARWTQGG
jgi:hypothetical protein